MYVMRLGEHLAWWLAEWRRVESAEARFTSVFWGGGTPGLFVEELAPIMEQIRPHLDAGAEVSIECNPRNVTESSAAAWRKMGITRLSIGVQSFSAAGLKILTRDHSGDEARAGVENALKHFDQVNIDLIYGWPGQDLAAWQRDLDESVRLGVGHVSCYNLTYESRTALGKQAARGVVQPATADLEADMYAAACATFARAGFDHEEVSNWSRPGHSCAHNWLYWNGDPYIGVGVGAHGYVPDGSAIGMRYFYDRNDRSFLREELPVRKVVAKGELAQVSERESVHESVQEQSQELKRSWLLPPLAAIDPRGLDQWLTEMVGVSLRTCKGVALDDLLKKTGRRFVPSPALKEGMTRGMCTFENGRFTLTPAEWFRETGWAVELIRSVVE